jgi:hypothetical protein
LRRACRRAPLIRRASRDTFSRKGRRGALEALLDGDKRFKITPIP